MNKDIMPNKLDNNYSSYLELMANYDLNKGINYPTRLSSFLNHFMVKEFTKYKLLFLTN